MMKILVNSLVNDAKQSAPKLPEIKLNNGKIMPAIGLSTRNMSPDVAEKAVLAAIKNGYRLVDTASVFENEVGVGKAINAKLTDGEIQRAKFFLTHKLWNCCHSPALVRPAIKKSLENLNLCFIDLYLMHTPMGFVGGHGFYPRDEKNNLQFSNDSYVDTWRELEECVLFGHTKSIGVANFNIPQLEKLLKNCRIKPVVNQVECHPYLTNLKMSEFCKKNGIAMMTYSPLGSPNASPEKGVEKKDPLLENCQLKIIAEKHMHSIPQVLIRYQLQNGYIVLPRTSNPENMKDNIDILNFQLSSNEMKAINDLNANYRINKMIECEKHTDYPFHIEKEKTPSTRSPKKDILI